MDPSTPPESDARSEKKPDEPVATTATRSKTLILVCSIAGFVLWAHFGSGMPVFHSQVVSEPGWEQFRVQYRIGHFGDDGQFVRAVQNGYNLVYHTHKYAPRFVRDSTGNRAQTCSACHTAEDLAYGFVNSDRVDPKLGKRISFEDRVRWCYAGSMDGFVPTIYDPAIRDIRLLARAVAHHLQLGEGELRTGK